MILHIKHKEYLELLHQKNQSQINKYDICENIIRINYYNKVGDKVMLYNKVVYKLKTHIWNHLK